MNTQDLLADGLQRNLAQVQMTLADFSDADMFVRPCPDANHVTWQLGHLIASERRLLNAAKPGSAPDLDASFSAMFNKESHSVDDPGRFLAKAKLLETFLQTREQTIAALRKMTDDDLAKPSPEPLRRIGPTAAHIALALPMHGNLHLGQFQVARRKLGKPVLF